MLHSSSVKQKDDDIEVNLIINDSTSTKIHLNLLNSNNELITQICDDISLKYYLDERTKTQLNNHLCREILRLRNKRDRTKEIEARRDEFFSQLYYNSINHKREKEDSNHKLRLERKEKELSEYSFTPSINVTPSKLFKKQYKRIEDKLYYQSKIIQTKKMKSRVNSDNDDERSFFSKENVSQRLIHDERAKAKIHHGCHHALDRENNFHNKMNMNQENSITSPLKKSRSDLEIAKASKAKSSLVMMTQDKRTKAIKQRIINAKSNSYLKNVIITTENNDNNHIHQSIYSDFNNNNNKLNNGMLMSRSSSKQRLRKQAKLSNELFSFTPLISNKSQQIMLSKRNESNEIICRRLTESKRTNSFQSALQNLHSTYNTESNTNISTKTIITKREQKPELDHDHDNDLNTNSRNNLFVKDNKRMVIKTDNNDTALSTHPQSSSFFNKRLVIKSTVATESKQERLMSDSIKEIRRSQRIGRKHYVNSQMTNLKKYKLNQLKNIYEILTKQSQALDFEALIPNGVPQNIKDMVVMPACSMINSQHLEFNFHNFYLIANEIMNKYF